MTEPTLRHGPTGMAGVLSTLFQEVFTSAEGAAEGALIGTLAKTMLETAALPDLYVFSAWQGAAPIGCILFSRLSYSDPRAVFLLSPVAVVVRHPGRGLGQKMIQFGLGGLRESSAEVAVTYGDPAFYQRVGLAPVSIAALPPPLPLSQPEGWLAQSLTNAPLTALQGPSHCLTAFNDPRCW